VYAFGVIAFELLAGRRPFVGPGVPDLREQHLHAPAPALTGHSAALTSLVEECLFKAPEARPTPANLLARLGRASHVAANTGLAALQQADRAEVARRGQADRVASEARSAADRRADLLSGARQLLTRIGDALRDAVIDRSSECQVENVARGQLAADVERCSVGVSPVCQDPDRTVGRLAATVSV
jgi:hypothetical protein